MFKPVNRFAHVPVFIIIFTGSKIKEKGRLPVNDDEKDEERIAHFPMSFILDYWKCIRKRNRELPVRKNGSWMRAHISFLVLFLAV